MAENDERVRFFDSLNESYDATIDAVRAANNRTHRFTTTLIEDAQQNQRDAVDLAKKWADSPLDFLGFYSAAVDTATKAQGRALDATRELFKEASEARKESGEALQRVASVNRNAGDAAVTMARGAINRANQAVQSSGRRGANGSGKSDEADEAPAEETPKSRTPKRTGDDS